MKSFKIGITHLIAILSLILITSCKDNKELDGFPVVETLAVDNISEKGATFYAKVKSTGNESIIDHGFVWSDTANSTNYNENYKISLGVFNGKGVFKADIERNLRPNFQYHIRAYIKTTNHLDYGKAVAFKSLGSNAPIISDFEPKIVEWGDTITIHGKYFGLEPDSNKIYINSTPASIIKYSELNNDSTILVIIPSNLGTSKNLITIKQLGNTNIYTKDTLKLKLPILNDFYPRLATWNDTITLTGNFPTYKRYTYRLYLYNTNPDIIKLTSSTIKFVLPSNLQKSTSIILQVSGYWTSLRTQLMLRPPIIYSFAPSQICFCDVIQIKGKFFHKYLSKVKIDSKDISVISVIGDSIINAKNEGIIYLPGTYKFSVEVAEQAIQAQNDLTYLVPKINEIVPSECTFLDTLSIYGDFYSKVTGNSLFINGEQQNIIYSSPNLFKVVVPAKIRTDNSSLNIGLSTYCGYIYKPNAFKIKTPIVYSLSKYEGRKGDIITISGDYFNPTLGGQSVYVGEILSATKNQIVFKIGTVTSDITRVNIFSWLHGDVLATDRFRFIAPYKKLAGVSHIAFGYSFSIGDFGYAGGGYYDNRIWKFDPKNNKWTPIISLSDNKIYGPAYFVINDKGYIVGGSLDNLSQPSALINAVKVFDPIANTVSKKNDFPGTPRIGSFCFSIGNKGFLGGGEHQFNALNDFWEYNSETDSWIQKANFPGGYCKGASAFVIGQKAYVFNLNELWAYTPSEDKWERKADFPGDKRYLTNSFAIGNKGYIANGSIYFGYYLLFPSVFYDDMWEYDSEKDSWTAKSPYPSYKCFGGASFTIDNKGYLGLGGLESGNGNYNWQFFEYDPTQEP